MQELQAFWSLDNDIKGEVLIKDKYVFQIGCIGSIKEFEPLLLLIFCFWKWKHSSSIIAGVIIVGAADL